MSSGFMGPNHNADNTAQQAQTRPCGVSGFVALQHAFVAVSRSVQLCDEAIGLVPFLFAQRTKQVPLAILHDRHPHVCLG